MARGGPRPGSGRPRKDGLPIGSPRPKRVRKKAPGVLAEQRQKKADAIGQLLGQEVVKGYTGQGGTKVPEAPSDWPFGVTPPGAPGEKEPVPDGIDPVTGLPVDPGLDPLELLKRISRNPRVDIRSRIQAATVAIGYLHPKKAEGGKKEDKDEAAKRAAQKFAPAAAPLKLVNPGG